MAVQTSETAYAGELPPNLIRLIHDDQKRVTAAKIWKALEDDERITALRLLIRRRRYRDDLVWIVAKARKFRPDTVRKMNNDQIIRMANGLPVVDPGGPPRPGLPNLLLATMLCEMHLERRREMLAHFLGALGIPNDDGDVEDYDDHDSEEEEVYAAADDLAREHGLRRSVVYFLTLAILPVPFADHLWSWMRRLGEDGREKPPAVSSRSTPSGTPVSVPASAKAPQPTAEAATEPSTPVFLPPTAESPQSPTEAEPEKPEPPSPTSPPAVEPPANDQHRSPDGEGDDAHPEAWEETEDPHQIWLEVRDTLLTDHDPHFYAERASRLRKLDHLLIDALIDSRQGMAGCFDEDEISEAVDEFVNLNGRRHQSYFHAGFRDSLFGRPLVRELPAESEWRSRWYWTGVISGWRRRRSWGRIVDVYDAHAEVRKLGDGRDAATEEAAPHIVHALWREGRAGHISGFLSVRGLLSSLRSSSPSLDPRPPRPSLFDKAFEVGTDLLRGNRLDEADAIFDRLLEAARGFNDSEDRVPREHFLAILRRRAHCLRRRLRYQPASQLLQELVSIEDNPNYLAMAHADLGLIAGGFSNLADVALPSEAEDLPDFLDRLRAGSEHYARAAKKDAPYAAHGEYCLGVLALGELALEALDLGDRRWGEAEKRLTAARFLFGRRGENYREALGTRADLYFGIAAAGRVRAAQDVAHAAQVMAEALDGGARFPLCLLVPVIDGLEVGAGTGDLTAFANALVGRHGDDALDELSKNPTILEHCADVRDRLRERAKRWGASEAGAADYRSCLTGYLASGLLDDARTVLDRLEDLAVQGVGGEEFDALLKDEAYDPAWEKGDAAISRVKLLQTRGRRNEAFNGLSELFWMFAGQERIHDAEGVLRKMRTLVSDSGRYEQHARALEALASPSDDVANAPNLDPATRKHVKILFVGGDERQKREEEAVENRLRRVAPHIEATFIFPGWGGNWSRHLDDVERKLRTHDAMVLMRFVRTEFGRRCRKLCGSKPWRACWVSGQKAMVDSIIAAADAV